MPQYKAMEAAYKQKELASAAAVEIDEEAIEEIEANRKRKINMQFAKRKSRKWKEREKKQKRKK